jgi:hypothetical protein
MFVLLIIEAFFCCYATGFAEESQWFSLTKRNVFAMVIGKAEREVLGRS